jgi:hypothetical protein
MRAQSLRRTQCQHPSTQLFSFCQDGFFDRARRTLDPKLDATLLGVDHDGSIRRLSFRHLSQPSRRVAFVEAYFDNAPRRAQELCTQVRYDGSITRATHEQDHLPQTSGPCQGLNTGIRNLGGEDPSLQHGLGAADN